MDTKRMKEKILQLISNKAIDYKEIAYELHMTYGSVYYMLHEAKKVDVNLYTELEKLLNKKGYSSTEKGECLMLSKRTFDFNSLVAQTIQILNTEVREAIEDEKINEGEAKKIIESLDNFKENIDDEIEKIKTLLGTK